MALPNDSTNQNAIVGGITAIIVAIGVAWKYLSGGDKSGDVPMKAEVVTEGNRIMIEIPIAKVLEDQDKVLKHLADESRAGLLALARLQGSVENIKQQLDDANPWAQSVEKRFAEHGEKIAAIKGDVAWLKDRVHKFHNGE